ncbi:MAG: hypothetical protein ACE15B_16000 [Bryobacteraceae bacterium]
MRALATALVLLSSPAAADWLKLATEDFELLTAAGERRARGWAGTLDQVRRTFRAPPSARGLRLVVFGSRRDFEPYRVGAAASAYHVRSLGRDWIVACNPTPETLAHEYMHVLLTSAGLESKPWLSEGLAELYTANQPPPAVADAEWLTVDRLLAATRDSKLYAEPAFYARSWALVHMLHFSVDYRTGAATFLKAMAAGSTEADAFRAAFGKSLTQVEADLTGHIRYARWRGTLMARAPRLPLRATVRTLNPELDLAELLAAIRKPPCPYYARAAELGSRNTQLWFAYATLCRPEAREAALTRALALQPDFTEARLQLAFDLVEEGKYAAAVDHLRRIPRVVSDRAGPYFRALSLALFKLGRITECRRAAEGALRFARNAAEADEARSLLEQAISSTPPPAPAPPETGRPQCRNRPLQK